MARRSILALIAYAALGGSHLVSTDASAAGRGGGVSTAPPVASRILAPGPGAFARKRPSVDTANTTHVPTGYVGPTYQGASLPDAHGASYQTPQGPGLNGDAASVLSGNSDGDGVISAGRGAGNRPGLGGKEAGLGASSNLNNGSGDTLDAIGQGASALSGIAPANAASVQR